ncbi:hypothetical protein B9Z55_029156 [Caenorhabditis nigoni]|uniref:Uncharacterized protein n=1 Tax=Caenorhabditis nigoni TaxID=1611254 RepID=A0A2G5S8E3_9PELO|nr:hypothetical protein B9Z55_029156 [Caenorhabditis nigoni]
MFADAIKKEVEMKMLSLDDEIETRWNGMHRKLMEGKKMMHQKNEDVCDLLKGLLTSTTEALLTEENWVKAYTS